MEDKQHDKKQEEPKYHSFFSLVTLKLLFMMAGLAIFINIFMVPGNLSRLLEFVFGQEVNHMDMGKKAVMKNLLTEGSIIIRIAKGLCILVAAAFFAYIMNM